MQRCSECGYRGKYEWPALLGRIAFVILLVIFLNHVTGMYRLLGFGAVGLWIVADIWSEISSGRDHREHLRFHLGYVEGLRE